MLLILHDKVRKIQFNFKAACKKFFKSVRIYVVHNKVLYFIISLIVSTFLYIYIKLILLTSKISYEYPNNIYLVREKSVIFTFWHGRLLSAIFARKLVPSASVLISKSKDGDLITLLMRFFKVDVIKGSTSTGQVDKGGTVGFRQMIHLLKNTKRAIAVAPDGPIGPRMQVSPGIAMLSYLAQAPIMPITLSVSKGRVLNTWDRFVLPFPFGKIVVKVGEAIIPPAKSNNPNLLEEYRLNIEHLMVKLTQKLDSSLQMPLIMPSELDKKNNPLKRKLK